MESGGTIRIASHTGNSVYYGYDRFGDLEPAVVDGTFDIQVPLGGAVGHWYTGSGRVMMKDTGSKATTDYSIRLGGNVKFSAESFVRPITVEKTPTLCAVNDWTYSAGALTLRFGDDASLRAASGWMTVATVASGSAVSGLPALPSEEWQSRVVENGDGSKSLQCRLKTGMMLILN